MANTFRTNDFKNNIGLSYVLIGLFVAIAGLSAMYAVSSSIAVFAPDWVLDSDDGSSISVGLMFVGLFALLEIPLRLATIVVFLFWIYRAYSNLSPLRARGLQFSPGWAVGWWFIPFANLVKPFQVVREIYNESDPDIDPNSGFSHIPAGTPLELGVWWAAFLISGFAYRFSDMLYGSGDLPKSEYYPVAFLTGALLSIIAALLVAFIIRTITLRQSQRLEVVSRTPGQMVEPPAPPQFSDQAGNVIEDQT